MMPQHTENYSLSIVTLIQLLKKWKNKAMLFMLLLAIVSASILWLKPNIYYSYSTAIPTNATLNDKAYLFNDKIDNLYSSLGTFDDLNRLDAIAGLDTTFLYFIEKYNLVQHYHINAPNQNIAIQKTILRMKDEYVNFEKMQNGLFRIHVWDEDPKFAAELANNLMTYIEKANRNLQVEYNKNSVSQIAGQLESLTKSFTSLQDTLRNCKLESSKLLLQNKSSNLLAEINNLEKIKNQFETTIQFQQPSLRMVDMAVPNLKHVKPKRIYLFFSTMLVGFFVMLIFISILESFQSAFSKNE